MRVVVIGGTGLIGSKLVTKLAEHGHEAVPASPNTGVNTLTGDGLAEALEGADVVVDVSNSPSFEADAVLSFFETSTKNLLEAEEQAGVGHHVALSVVGTERLTRERLLPGQDRPGEADQRVPDPLFHRSCHTVLRVRQEHRRRGDGRKHDVRLAPVLIQPMAADDVAGAVGRTAVGPPVNGTIEVAGPEQFRLDELIRGGLKARKDPREVIADPEARYFGALLSERTLVPDEGAALGEIRFEDWLAQTLVSAP